jgi:nickel transport protein
MKLPLTGLLTAATLLAAADPARAHALCVECKLHGNEVRVEVFYSDNSPAADARVTVRDAAGNEVAAGRTDAQGVWTFARPAAGSYEVVADAGAGHRRSLTMTVPAAESPPAAGPPGDVTISEGPTRAEATAVPWGRVLLGLAVLAAVGCGARWVGRRRSPGPRP